MINNNLINILSDLFVNLSAGWFGAALIISIYLPDDEKINWSALLFNVFFGVLSLIASYIIINLI